MALYPQYSSSSFFLFLFMIFSTICTSITSDYWSVISPAAAAAASTSALCSQILHPQGYPCIDYTTVTEDGYILGVQRIPPHNGRRTKSGADRSADQYVASRPAPVVFLQHGLFVGGASWFLDTPRQSLGFVLSDAGFDVWVGNTRGSPGSQAHISPTQSSKEYWNWSWDELAAYDLPSMINLVYDVTKSPIYYIGHSQGTLIALAALSEGKLTTDRIVAAALLAPVAYITNENSPLVKLANEVKLDKIFQALGINEVDLRREPILQILNDTCVSLRTVCYDVIRSFSGRSCCINASRVPYYLNYFPEPTSTVNGIHYFQMLRQGSFSRFDYGAERNYEVYGTPVPPPYDLSKIPDELPVFLAYGGRDILSDPADVGNLIGLLPCRLHTLFLPSYAHLDFVLSTSGNADIYSKLVAFFNAMHSKTLNPKP